MAAPTPSRSTRTSPHPLPWVLTIIGVVVVAFAGILFLRMSSATPPTTVAVAPAAALAPMVVVQAMPTPVYATTPATLVLDYSYHIVALRPIMIQYPGEGAFLFTPREGCQQLPEPRRSGPKKFWDPDNPATGKIAFAVFAGPGKC